MPPQAAAPNARNPSHFAAEMERWCLMLTRPRARSRNKSPVSSTRRVGRRVRFREAGDSFRHIGTQFGWSDDFGGGAPTENPLLHFVESAQAEAQFQTAAGRLSHLLRFVPLAFAHAFGHGRRAAD